MKYVIGAAIAVILVICGANFAFSQEAEAPAAKCTLLEAIRPTLEKAGVTVSEVPKGVVDALVAAKGLPPKTVAGFKLYRNDLGPQSQIFTVNPDGCVGYVSPIMNRETANKFLGVTDA